MLGVTKSENNKRVFPTLVQLNRATGQLIKLARAEELIEILPSLRILTTHLLAMNSSLGKDSGGSLTALQLLSKKIAESSKAKPSLEATILEEKGDE